MVKIALAFTLVFMASAMTREKDQKPIKIGLIDSFYCDLPYYQVKYPGVIFEFIGTKDDRTTNCLSVKPKGPSFHGHLVLENILKSMGSKKTVHFYLASVFTRVGTQHSKLWIKAIEKFNQLELDIVVSAAGYFQNENLKNYSLKSPTFLSAGNATRGITKETTLYPHSQNKENYFLIGSYKEPSENLKKHIKTNQKLLDPTLLHLSQLEFFMPDRGSYNKLQGSSFSVALFTGLIIKNCNNLKTLNSLKTCIDKGKMSISFKQSEKNSNSPSLGTKISYTLRDRFPK